MYMNGGVRFEWNSTNIEHIARHDVAPFEAEEVIRRNPVTLASVLSNGEERTICAGRTESGRALRIVYTIRNGKIRVITAHEDRKLGRIL
jgi:uncharacterized DUF497 family protein